jgi:hypothetical protein
MNFIESMKTDTDGIQPNYETRTSQANGPERPPNPVFFGNSSPNVSPIFPSHNINDCSSYSPTDINAQSDYNGGRVPSISTRVNSSNDHFDNSSDSTTFSADVTMTEVDGGDDSSKAFSSLKDDN